ncbi:NAD-dependent epimerase/dehydratase family protein [Micromonospora sp. WMMD1082]|uniref:NAD-dependent epimerase/dehydratase family protein n=1 Tax=Micromonospora sp. WMMD1082 TaxID=3016104 RepID=UPI002417DEEB|nr:NAD-dependent epimerase/dehydratase family protein [Micromonospora sp. WMMD1082]MDG4798335.1 NAD-dependent epimerase/dehydratase family protein [Micromonospora sp. WMMD1082]
MTTDGWSTGPVAVVGADGQVGSALRDRLAELPTEVRPLRRGDDLRAAFRGADVVVHLAGALAPGRGNSYRAANRDTVAATCAALQDCAVRRVVFLSYLNVSAASANPYLRFKAEAEQLLQDCDTPAVIFRCAHIYGPPDQPGPTASALLGRHGRVVVPGPGSQRYAWIARDDVVEALVHAALDPSTPTGTFDLAGPQAYTVDEFVGHINPGPVRVRHLPGWAARLASRLVPGIPKPLIDVLLRDCLPVNDPRETADRFGFTLRTLTETWRRSP